MSLGRPTVLSESQVYAAIESQKYPLSSDDTAYMPYIELFLQTLELYAISYHAIHIRYTQKVNGSGFADGISLSNLREGKDYLDIAFDLDNRINKWEQDLPPFMRPGLSQDPIDENLSRLIVFSRLR
jgi:hypothetical protein